MTRDSWCQRFFHRLVIVCLLLCSVVVMTDIKEKAEFHRLTDLSESVDQKGEERGQDWRGGGGGGLSWYRLLLQLVIVSEVCSYKKYCC